MRISKIKNRIYNDYFMKNRYSEYELLIKNLLENRYQFITISEYKKLLSKGKYIIIRHDIDSDVDIAKRMFEIEKKYNVRTTFYFRTCTFDRQLMLEINDFGSEVGYHFEEIATYVKKHKLKSRKQILENMPDIQRMFVDNIQRFEDEFDIKLSSIAAHGDFINRKYKIVNNELFDKRMRKKFSNIVEAYDDEIESNLDFSISDDVYPNFWKPNSPFDAIKNKKRRMLILIHTRWWNSAPLERFKCEVNRVIEGIKY